MKKLQDHEKCRTALKEVDKLNITVTVHDCKKKFENSLVMSTKYIKMGAHKEDKR